MSHPRNIMRIDFRKEDPIGTIKERLASTGWARYRTPCERAEAMRELAALQRAERLAAHIERQIVPAGSYRPRERRSKASKRSSSGSSEDPGEGEPARGRHSSDVNETSQDSASTMRGGPPAEGGRCNTATHGVERATAPVGRRRGARRAAPPLKVVSFADFMAEDLGRG